MKTIATPKGKYYYTFRVIWEDAINLTGFWDPKFILLKWEIPDFSWDSKCEKDTRFSLTIQSGLFFRKIVEIEHFALRAVIDGFRCTESSLGISVKSTYEAGDDLEGGDTIPAAVHLKPKWQPITQSARSRRSYRKIGHCERSRRRVISISEGKEERDSR